MSSRPENNTRLWTKIGDIWIRPFGLPIGGVCWLTFTLAGIILAGMIGPDMLHRLSDQRFNDQTPAGYARLNRIGKIICPIGFKNSLLYRIMQSIVILGWGYGLVIMADNTCPDRFD